MDSSRSAGPSRRPGGNRPERLASFDDTGGGAGSSRRPGGELDLVQEGLQASKKLKREHSPEQGPLAVAMQRAREIEARERRCQEKVQDILGPMYDLSENKDYFIQDAYKFKKLNELREFCETMDAAKEHFFTVMHELKAENLSQEMRDDYAKIEQERGMQFHEDVKDLRGHFVNLSRQLNSEQNPQATTRQGTEEISQEISQEIKEIIGDIEDIRHSLRGLFRKSQDVIRDAHKTEMVEISNEMSIGIQRFSTAIGRLRDSNLSQEMLGYYTKLEASERSRITLQLAFLGKSQATGSRENRRRHSMRGKGSDGPAFQASRRRLSMHGESQERPESYRGSDVNQGRVSPPRQMGISGHISGERRTLGSTERDDGERRYEQPRRQASGESAGSGDALGPSTSGVELPYIQKLMDYRKQEEEELADLMGEDAIKEHRLKNFENYKDEIEACLELLGQDTEKLQAMVTRLKHEAQDYSSDAENLSALITKQKEKPTDNDAVELSAAYRKNVENLQNVQEYRDLSIKIGRAFSVINDIWGKKFPDNRIELMEIEQSSERRTKIYRIEREMRLELQEKIRIVLSEYDKSKSIINLDNIKGLNNDMKSSVGEVRGAGELLEPMDLDPTRHQDSEGGYEQLRRQASEESAGSRDALELSTSELELPYIQKLRDYRKQEDATFATLTEKDAIIKHRFDNFENYKYKIGAYLELLRKDTEKLQAIATRLKREAQNYIGDAENLRALIAKQKENPADRDTIELSAAYRKSAENMQDVQEYQDLSIMIEGGIQVINDIWKNKFPDNRGELSNLTLSRAYTTTIKYGSEKNLRIQIDNEKGAYDAISRIISLDETSNLLSRIKFSEDEVREVSELLEHMNLDFTGHQDREGGLEQPRRQVSGESAGSGDALGPSTRELELPYIQELRQYKEQEEGELAALKENGAIKKHRFANFKDYEARIQTHLAHLRKDTERLRTMATELQREAQSYIDSAQNLRDLPNKQKENSIDPVTFTNIYERYTENMQYVQEYQNLYIMVERGIALAKDIWRDKFTNNRHELLSTFKLSFEEKSETFDVMQKIEGKIHNDILNVSQKHRSCSDIIGVDACKKIYQDMQLSKDEKRNIDKLLENIDM